MTTILLTRTYLMLFVKINIEIEGKMYKLGIRKPINIKTTSNEIVVNASVNWVSTPTKKINITNLKEIHIKIELFKFALPLVVISLFCAICSYFFKNPTFLYPVYLSGAFFLYYMFFNTKNYLRILVKKRLEK